MSDPYVGKLTYVGSTPGHLKAGERVLNTTTGRPSDRRILLMHATTARRSEPIATRRICASSGSRTSTGATTLATRRHRLARFYDLPGSRYLGCDRPRRRPTRTSSRAALPAALPKEDPATFRVDRTRRRGRRSRQGRASLHLDIIVRPPERRVRGLTRTSGPPPGGVPRAITKPRLEKDPREVRRQTAAAASTASGDQPGAGARLGLRVRPTRSVGGKIPEGVHPAIDSHP